MPERTIILNIEQILSEIETYNNTGESDFLAELMLEFYKEGQYLYYSASVATSGVTSGVSPWVGSRSSSASRAPFSFRACFFLASTCAWRFLISSMAALN